MRTIVIDGAEMATREQAHRHLAQRLAFPHWYGHNLDALYDCLTDVSEATLLVLYRGEAIAREAWGTAMIDTIRDAARENPKLIFAADGDDLQL